MRMGGKRAPAIAGFGDGAVCESAPRHQQELAKTDEEIFAIPFGLVVERLVDDH